MKVTDYGRSPEEVTAEPGEKFTTEELREKFDVLGFEAPYIVAVRKSDGVKGSFEFGHHPRVYFGWREH